MIVPILPLYLTTVLHVQAGSLGIIEGIAEFTASLLILFSGWITDRVGKQKLLMVIDYGLSNLTKPFFAWSSSWSQVLLIRFTDHLGKGIRVSPRDAHLADSTTKEERGKTVRLPQSYGCSGSSFGAFSGFCHFVHVPRQLSFGFLVIRYIWNAARCAARFFPKNKGTRASG